MCEHHRVSALTRKKVNGVSESAIKEHLVYNHWSGFDNFPILASDSNDFKVTLKERLLINRDHSLLKKKRHLLHLELLDDWGT